MESREIKTDRRVIKTKRAIYRAMAQLLAQKDINEISIKDIADLADINRKTFYNYYAGVYQLVDEIENTIVAYFAKLIEQVDFEQVITDPSVVFGKLLETVNSHMEYVDALFKINGNSSLVNKVQSKLIDMTCDAAVEHFRSDRVRTEYIVRFIFAGEIAAYQAWYQSGQQMPIQELSRIIETLCTKGLNAFLSE